RRRMPAGVVDEAIEPIELGGSAVDRHFELLAMRHVAGNIDCPPRPGSVQLSRQREASFFASRQNGDESSLAAKDPRAPFTDPLASPGDHHGFSLKSHAASFCASTSWLSSLTRVVILFSRHAAHD